MSSTVPDPLGRVREHELGPHEGIWFRGAVGQIAPRHEVIGLERPGVEPHGVQVGSRRRHVPIRDIRVHAIVVPRVEECT